MSIVLTLTQTQLTAINPINGAFVAQYNDAAITNSKNRIGELKRVKYSFTSTANIFVYKFYINPGLFMNKSAPPVAMPGLRYYYVQPTGVGLHNASYNALGATFPNIDKLYNVYLVASSATAFDIYIEYYQSYDHEGFLEPNIGDNQSHLLKDKKSSTSILNVSGSSIYNDTNIDLRMLLYAEHLTVSTDNASYDYNSGYGYKAGFYQKGNTNVSPYFTNPGMFLQRSSGLVTSLSSVEDTIVSFGISSPSFPVQYMVATIIRTDKTDNTVDFATNYELQQVLVDPITPATSKLKSFVSVVPLFGGYWCQFKVDKTGLILGAKYRIIMHSYYNNFPTNYEVDAFMSDEFEVNADVPYTGNGFDISARLRDLFHGYAGNQLTCSIEERIRSEITLDYMDDYGINMYFRDIYNRLGKTINDVSRYLASITFTIYDTASTPGQRHVVDQRTMYKAGPGMYIGRNGFSVTFNTGNIALQADWRNRYEAGQLNNMTYDVVTGVAMGQLSNQYWGGRSFFIEWSLNYYYDDYITPFTDEVIIQQQMTVKDYSSCVQIHAQNPPDEDKAFWCPEDIMCLRSEFTCGGGVPPVQYHLVTTIEPDPGSITTIKENEVFSPVILPQQTTPLIYNQEDRYNATLANNAKFCVDVASLTLTDYKITAFAKHD